MKSKWLLRGILPGWLLAAGILLSGPAIADPPSGVKDEDRGREERGAPAKEDELGGPRDGDRRGRRPPEDGSPRMSKEEWDHLRSLMERAHATEEVKTAQQAAKDSFAAYRKKLNETILGLDPSAAGLLAKVEERYGGRGQFPFNGGRPDRGRPDGPPFRLDVLSEGERAQFLAAWKAIGGDEKMAEFRRTMDEGERPGDPREQFQKYRGDIAALLTAQDPGLAALIERMDEAGPRDRDRERDGEGGRGRGRDGERDDERDDERDEDGGGTKEKEAERGKDKDKPRDGDGGC